MERDVGNTRTYAGNNNINKLVVNGHSMTKPKVLKI
jgi:hypothetical protein